MKGLVRVVAIASMSVVAASTMQAQALPTATAVISRYIEAVGGKDAIMKIKSVSQEATMEVPSIGLSASMEVHSAAPNLSAMKSSIPGVGEMVQGFNGTVGWDINPMQGPRLLTDKELTQAKENNDFYASRLFSPELYSKQEVLEETTFANEKAYKVKMVRKSGNEATYFFSTTSGLLLGSEVTQESAMGAMSVQSKFTDYQVVEGIKIPMKTEITAGPNTIITSVKSTKFNAAPASAFDIPANVKPLIKQ